MRKRVSWYGKKMQPCRMLKEGARLINSGAELEDVIERFLEWRLRHDEEVKAGRAAAVPEDEMVEAA